MNRWINLLTLLPSTSLTLLIISIAFLRFYNETDFTLLGQLTSPRLWSNRLTLAALLVAVVNLGVEWNRRNRETDRLAEAEQRRSEDQARAMAQRAEEKGRREEEERRRIEERAEDERRRRENRARAAARRAEEANRRAEAEKQATRRTRVEIERDLALLNFLADPSEDNRNILRQAIALLLEYRDSL
ncbi:hypothetical protein GS597_20085 [Synechococcales cyanobacterium C]|uniref:Uncharacterized protein n=1 Tax=Petrachloros mirabilis ULC683 TaxID=2781853 RepID=A0A8K2AA33_9CYAN|nr:hypothetical protein [Petrachloros mirabilis]NCJ08765.1 hypothetical protein [Petrachloros mirabilis ULC683]